MSTLHRVVFVLGAVGIVLTAQEFRATVSGTITDAQGAIVPGARVEVKNLATNVAVSTVTNETGVYVAPFVTPGNYSIVATHEGFKRALRDNIELRVGDRVRVDFALEVGGVAEQVTVSASAELLETQSASKGQVIDSAKVRDLPLLGRNPFLLAAISAGVQYTPTRQSRSNRPFDNGGMDNFSMNGGRTFSNEFLLDGVPDTNTETTGPSNLSFVPSPDATEEFKVQTNNYDSQYGRSGGGVVNVSLKSGTNRLHGTLYHYFRNDKLNANAFESNAAGVGRSAFRWNQPGIQIDGPVFLPKLYNGRDRTFFMFSWEKIKSQIPFPQTYTVPTAQQRSGDFSRTLQANGQPILIFDPTTTVLVGNAYTRQPFAGNRVPANRFDPVGAKLADYIAAPNQPGNEQGFNNLVASPNPVSDEYDQFITRFDQTLTSKHKVFSRYVRGNRHEVNSDAGYKHEASPWYSHWRINQGANFDLTSTLSPTLVSSLRVGYIRHQFAIQQYGEGFDPAQLGFPASAVSSLPRKFFPRIGYTDYSSFGPQRSTGSEFTFSDTWSAAETLNKVVGSHSLKAGAEFRVLFNNQDRPTSSFARFDFSKGYTQRDPLRGDAASGNAFASLLLGIPGSGSSDRNVAPAYGNHYYVLFVQDDWRLSRKLTLNLGFRWDYESPQTERFNQMNRGFDPTGANPFQVPGLQLKGGLLFTDDKNRLPYQRDLNNFQPRAGVAYQIGPKTVFRGGYGLSYLPTFDTGGNTGFSVVTSYVSSVDNGVTPSGKVSNPFPDGYLNAAGRSQGLATLVGNGYSYGYNSRAVPYVHQYSAGFQHELAGRILIDASYVGSRTSALQTSKGINEISTQQLSLGTIELNRQVTNPFQGRLPGTAFNGTTVPQRQLMRPFPQFTGITQNLHTIGTSWFESLQLRVEKRMSRGVHFLASYTISKGLEAVGYLNSQDSFGSLAKVITGVDAPHRLVMSGGWELPFFKGQRNVAGQFLGGWSFTGIATIQSGQPIGTPGGAYSSGISAAVDGQSLNRWFNPCTLNTAGVRQNCLGAGDPVAFIQQPPDTLRVLSTRFPEIRNRREPIVDFSVFKTFLIRESLRVQFRAESFNLLNTPWFGNPNTTLGSSNFGVVTPAQSNDPRNVQLALRLMF
ncbi:MAG: TonB-dependent receptor [Candidatus Solibacter usitatus]|nr:TonB-dependent receptor [Candidatus Solibacter usitatus]